MSSLFDIAAGLSQFNAGGSGDEDPWSSSAKDSDDNSSTPELDIGFEYNSKSQHTSAQVSARRRQSALCILDETLQTIYDTRRSPSPALPPLLPSLSASNSSEQRKNRLRQLNAATASVSAASLSHSGSASELRSVYSHSIAYQQQLEVVAAHATTRAELKTSPATITISKNSNQSGDPDMLAKTVLREIGDEIEQLTVTHDHHRTQEQRDAIVRFITDKYIDARLNKLPGTPFVQLARRKALQKIQQLGRSDAVQVHSSNEVAASTAAHPPQQRNQHHQHQDASELWGKLSALTPQQREMLQKLTRVSEPQASSLPPQQRELVHFAKRLERARAVSAQELSCLEPSHQRIVLKLQQSK